MPDKVHRLDLGFVPDSAVAGAVLLQDEFSTFLTFNGQQSGSFEDVGTGIIEFDLCSVSRFGYPNDEALSGHSLYRSGLRHYAVFEIQDSSWIREITEANRVSFPDTPNDTTSHHYVFTFHDSTFERIAHGLHARLDTRPFSEIVSE